VNHIYISPLCKPHTLSSRKDSRFGFSVLSSVEAHRFQVSAYLFCQFQALFGLGRLARGSPYEDPKPNWEDGLTRQSFLERISAMSLLHLSAFKDYLLSCVEDSYQALEEEGWIDDVDLTEGRYVSRGRIQKVVTKQILHRLLSAGLSLVIEVANPGEAWNAIHDPDHRYTGLQLWFATDLDLAIDSAAIPPEVKNSDDAKLVIRQGVMSTSCGWP